MGTVNNLVNIRLGNNSLRGTIPGNVTTNSQMLLLELHDNPLIHGTLPDVSKMVGIRTLDLHNTSLSGSIPEALGTLPYLERVDITLTHMLCCENQAQADALAAQGINKLLPSFLLFNNRMQLFDTTRNMHGTEMGRDQPTDVLCGSVERRLQPEAVWNVMQLPVTNNAVKSQRWNIGPLYSFYKNCTCTPAYVQDSSTRVPVNITSAWGLSSSAPQEGPCLKAYIFSCSPRQPPQLSLMQQVAVGMAVAFCSVLLAVMANTCMAHASKVRRYYIRAKTRLKGTPKHGRMSLVVTDIEGYSEIFKRAPEVMFRALVMHNSVIRTAKYANCGCVLEQEGDSFTLGFYSAFDAVAFCLQAQQALLSVQWPDGLGTDEPGLPSTEPLSARRPSRLQQRLSQLLTSGARRKSQQSKSTASSAVSEGESFTLHVSPSGQLSQALASRLAGLKAPAEPRLFSGLRVRMGVCTGDVPSGTPIKSSALFQLAKVVSDFGNGGQVMMDHVTFASVKESLTVLGAVGAGGINYTRLATHRSLWTTLKVMMGCTSPLDPAEEAVVLDMGAYYMPQGTHSSTDQPDTPDLACYPAPGNPNDSDDDEQQQQQQPDGCWRRWSACLQQLRSNSGTTSAVTTASSSKQGCGPSPSSAADPSGAASRPRRDSRLSQLSSLLRRQAGSSGGTAAGSAQRMSQPPPLQQQQPQPRPSLAGHAAASTSSAAPAAGGADAASAQSVLERMRSFRRMLSSSTGAEVHHGSGGSRRQRDWNRLRLFQVLPPSLAGRAQAWHNRLNIKDGWRPYDMPFFDAPGSTAVPLSAGAVSFHPASVHGGCLGCGSPPARTPSSAAAVAGSAVKPVSGASTDGAQGLSTSSLALQRLPAVTMVFMSAENPEQLVRRRRSFTPKVQALLHQAVRDGLRRCGGYLCRVQEGDLRFMVAFASPVAALEWCLVVQQAAMYLPWPAEPVLLYEGCTVERDGRGASCSGVPASRWACARVCPPPYFPTMKAAPTTTGRPSTWPRATRTRALRAGRSRAPSSLHTRSWQLGQAAAAAAAAAQPYAETEKVASTVACRVVPQQLQVARVQAAGHLTVRLMERQHVRQCQWADSRRRPPAAAAGAAKHVSSAAAGCCCCCCCCCCCWR
ncbi:hypothetical protein COO60DRAFT_610652 [Scenedesmus sp. NREL 46B-D3]|nr:hypothetical protein COO60DRAFT_610652 [Scenedesmus sp. NREL 46B-D3]